MKGTCREKGWSLSAERCLASTVGVDGPVRPEALEGRNEEDSVVTLTSNPHVLLDYDDWLHALSQVRNIQGRGIRHPPLPLRLLPERLEVEFGVTTPAWAR